MFTIQNIMICTVNGPLVKTQVLPGFEPGFWEDYFKIPSDNHYTIAPPESALVTR